MAFINPQYPPVEYQQQQPLPAEENVKVTQAYSDTADPDLIKHQLNIDDSLIDVFELMKGLDINTRLQKQLLITLKSVCNRNTFLSNLEEEEIRIAGQALCNDINEAVLFDCKKKGGDNLTVNEKNTLMGACHQYILSSLKRPLTQGERVFLSKTSEQRQIVQTRQEDKKSRWKSLFKW